MANDLTTSAGVDAEIARVQALIEGSPAGSQKIGEASRSGAMGELVDYLKYLFGLRDVVAAEQVEYLDERESNSGAYFGQ